MRFEIRPAAAGGWFAVVAGPRLLLLPQLDDPAVALDALAEEDGFRRIVDLLTARGLTAMPPFVLLDGADRPRLIVRGPAAVTVEDADGERVVDASGVSTWVEEVIPGLRGIAVELPGATAAADALPLMRGTAYAAAASATIADAVLPAEAAEPEPETAEAEPSAASADTAPPPASAPPPPAGAPVAAAPPPAGAPVAAAPPAGFSAADADPHGTVIVPIEADGDPAAPLGDEGEPGGAYDYLFGVTVHRSVAEAAVAEAEAEDPDAAPDAGAAERAGDHDGQTVLTADLAKLRGRAARTAAAPPAEPEPPTPAILMPNGTRERLDQPIIVGRSPGASQVTGGAIPKLIAVGSGDHDISRSHARFALEGGTVVVTDLHSVNGTTVALPGRDPQRLRAGEPTSVLLGAVIDLGGGVTFTVVDDAAEG